MDGARNTHAYKALDSSRREIRVLQLLAGDEHDGKVRATLIHADLDQRPVYDALSYTWGDPADTTTIELDGNEDYDLRSSVQFTHIWVDSICIYQDRYRTKCCRNLRFEPQFCEGGWFCAFNSVPTWAWCPPRRLNDYIDPSRPVDHSLFHLPSISLHFSLRSSIVTPPPCTTAAQPMRAVVLLVLLPH
jgi:hypothetical protein